MIIHTLTA